MKKKYLPIIIIVLITSTKTIAQEKVDAYTKGSSAISVGYGFFNIWKTFFNTYGGYVATSAVGPVILKYEYGISKKISANLTAGYSQVNANGDLIGFTLKLTNYLIVAEGNYHFLTDQKFDPYIGIGLGYYKFKFTSNDPQDVPLFFTLPAPFAISLKAGAKYYFSKHFGAYAEAGYVDGAIAQIGFTYKIK